jgi:hypothetical protein
VSSSQADRSAPLDRRRGQVGGRTTVLTWSRELAWFLLPLALCPIVALLRPGSEREAVVRAELLLAWERSVGIAVEPSIHAWFGARALLPDLATAFYLGAHLSALIATACWLAARRHGAYVRFRRTFALAQLLTVLGYLAVPVAPLRMLLPDASVTAGGSWTHSIQYEFAAMPSGHVVFALVVGAALWQHAPSRWRWIGIAHPAGTLVVIVATANHLIVDALAAVPVVVVSTWAARTVEVVSRPTERRTAGAIEERLVA